MLDNVLENQDFSLFLWTLDSGEAMDFYIHSDDQR